MWNNKDTPKEEPNLAQQTQFTHQIDPINAVWNPIWPNKPSFGHQFGPENPPLCSQVQTKELHKSKGGGAWMLEAGRHKKQRKRLDGLIAPRLCMLR